MTVNLRDLMRKEGILDYFEEFIEVLPKQLTREEIIIIVITLTTLYSKPLQFILETVAMSEKDFIKLIKSKPSKTDLY